MKKFAAIILAVFMVIGFSTMASAALTFNLDFGQDGSYENYWELLPSECVFIDLYVSGVPSGDPINVIPLGQTEPVPIVGLNSMGIDITYDPSAVEITPGTEFKMDLLAGSANTENPGSIIMSGVDFNAMLFGRDGAYGDDLLVGTIEFHCKGPFGITDLWLWDADHGGAFDDWVLFDGTVLDGDISSGIKLAEINQIVPIPGAVWLFGSGLIGLVGLRRRRS